MTDTQAMAARPLDLICLGRLAVDLYAQQVGARLEDVSSFSKYLGGSSANIAFGTARLGLKSAMLSRVGDDHMGRFLTETLTKEGCDIRGIKVDKQRLTGMVLLGIKDSKTFPLVFYRENCADMALCAEDIDENYIASSRALLITGTHFSTEGVFGASMRALEYAAKHSVQRILDIDYRPVLWGLTGKADGETRFVASDEVTRHIQKILPHFDLIVGTEEEFAIAGGSEDLIQALSNVRKLTSATLVVKLGAEGCVVLRGEIPARLSDVPKHSGIQVQVLNVLGAGDAFMSGFLSGWLRGDSDARSCELGNACGALVVSRHACAPAMPTPAELNYVLNSDKAIVRPDLDSGLNRLHRVSIKRKQWGPLFVFAFDHRHQFFEFAQQAGADVERISELKLLFVEAVRQVRTMLLDQGVEGNVGILADERYGLDALNEATGQGWWIGRPVEMQYSRPLVFEAGRSIGSSLIKWPQEHVIKCLVQYHPDDEPLLRLEQEAQIKALYEAAQISGHEILMEFIPPKGHASTHGDVLLRSMKRLYNLGIYPDWWKIESQPREVWTQIDALIQERDPYCRGVVVLGLNAPSDELAKGFIEAAESSLCKGFAVGRTIFQAPSQDWLFGKIDNATLISRVRANFESLISAWQLARKASASAQGQMS
ncbi:bifunctional 5-dehydro-2-deoxygluconokinase/5-dehydro-2-deoxyphosphogluconate aldolase [Stenotrophobium rhamnosiphilum]|uniref:5-dehydro-2-deoxygluconokinase n=1 Tax=Stenotrophobium rhamnosiphilum TaxID=2029166 RepID=A0A2T5ME92_9GAMM|nr:5-dehydro-2-deoxygluconokinase [Stenotrophobium rhamnosiphilum]PTU30895.1 5-dehydro-2-deoxygluconokinase [Stenotrophobium rhamnosiphilum]